MASVGSIFFGISTKDDLENGWMKRWYLNQMILQFSMIQKDHPAIFHCLTALMLYGFCISISLHVSIDIVKIIFINRDIYLYYEEADKLTHARTSNLNEELGQVDSILYDKTGTLTYNSMEFIRCSFVGVAYTEVEKAIKEVVHHGFMSKIVGQMMSGTLLLQKPQ
ncbi:hypothetical protein K1719_010964 [Acacia pycnantha]|nr:hypothetical protein K1719_010964 [Acacia pycnantha]